MMRQQRNETNETYCDEFKETSTMAIVILLCWISTNNVVFELQLVQGYHSKCAEMTLYVGWDRCRLGF